jgi:hypothetical protein
LSVSAPAPTHRQVPPEQLSVTHAWLSLHVAPFASVKLAWHVPESQ